jgi:hypothetical protein
MMGRQTRRVLIASPDRNLGGNLLRWIGQAGHLPDIVQGERDLLEALEAHSRPYDLVFLDEELVDQLSPKVLEMLGREELVQIGDSFPSRTGLRVGDCLQRRDPYSRFIRAVETGRPR